MSKKRKTRKQKERLEQRRQRRREVAGKETGPKATISGKTTGSPLEVPQDEDSRIAEKRLKLMKYSLGVFSVLVVTQFAVWWLLRSNLLPQAWVEVLLG